MTQKQIQKNRDELFEAIPKLRNVYKKSIFYVFIIRTLFLIAIPISLIIVLFITKPKSSAVTPIISILLIISIANTLYFCCTFFDYWIKTKREWKTFFEEILLPLYKLNAKEKALKALSESGLLFSQNINFHKMNIFDYITIGCSYKKRWYCLSLLMPFILVEIIWSEVTFKMKKGLGMREYKHKNNRYDLDGYSNNYYYFYFLGYNSYRFRLKANKTNAENKMIFPFFLLKETEEKLLRYIADNKKA